MPVQLNVCSNISGNALSIALDGKTLYVNDNKGNLYSTLLGSSGNSCKLIGVFPLKDSIYGLTVDSKGVVYAATGNKIERYYPATKSFDAAGAVLTIPRRWTIGGDLLFYAGKLYMAAKDSITKSPVLVQVDTANPSKSTLYLNLTASIFGFATVTETCKNNQGYALSDSGNIYLVNMAAKKQDSTKLCSLTSMLPALKSQQIYDAASIAESGQDSKPPAPSNAVSPIDVCQNGGYVLSVSPTVTSGDPADTLRWYVQPGVNAPTATPIVNTSAPSSTSYYVTQFNPTTKCESDSIPITINIRQLPATPAAVASPPSCAAASMVAVKPPVTGLSFTLTGTTTTLTSTNGIFNSVPGGTYSLTAKDVTYGCSSATAATVLVAPQPLSPSTPKLTATSICEGSSPTFAAINDSLYQFFRNDTAQTTVSIANTYSPGILKAGDKYSVRAYSTPPITFDGNITTAEWGAPLATSAGGPSSGFASKPELNALYAKSNISNLYIALAGKIYNDERAIIFIDSKTGGYKDGNFGRGDAPQGLLTYNSSNIFDANFLPDYALTIGTNAKLDSFYVNLYTLSGTAGNGGGPNYYLGNNSSKYIGVIQAKNGDTTKGFEIAVPLDSLGYKPAFGNIQLMAMYIANDGYLSNQFLSRANAGEQDYGIKQVFFNNAAPGPVSYSFDPGCYSEDSLRVTAKTKPTFTAIAPICSGTTAPVLPTTSIEGIAGTWIPSKIDSSKDGVFNFVFTPNASQCANSATLQVTIFKAVTLTTVPINPACGQTTVSLVAGQGASSNNSPTIDRYFYTDFAMKDTIKTGIVNIASTAKKYYIELINGNGCKVFDSILVNPFKPKPAVTTKPSILICNGNAVNLDTSYPTKDAGLTFQYYTDAALTVPAPNPVSTAGTYYAKISNGTCDTTVTLTVVLGQIPVVPAITGTTTVCVGSTIQLDNTLPAGTWSVDNTAIATIDGTGLVSGVSGGKAIATYTASNSCGSNASTATITVNDKPSVPGITGTTTVCVGSTTQLSNTLPAGTWSVDKSAIATIDGTGLVSGVSSGKAIVTYTASNSCGSNTSTATITVNDKPAVPAITGTTTVCVGSTTQLSNTFPGGTWSVDKAALATIDGTGLVSGVSGGKAIATYTASNSCGSNASTATITVNDKPSVPGITGTTTVCVGSTTQLSNTLPAGTWSVDKSAIATIDGTGLVSGVSSGKAIVTYTASNSCGSNTSTATITVNDKPAVPAITGTTTVCVGSTTQLSNTFPGGTWSVDKAALATIDGTGLVSGVSVGTAIVTYTASNSCGSNASTATITVNDKPSVAAITGTATVCVGSTTQLSNTLPGGTWSVDNTAIAIIDGTGLVSGVSGGTAVVTYKVSNSCGNDSKTATITVNSTPNVPAITVIAGSTTLCKGSTIQLGNALAGGVWSVDNATIATVNNNGLVVTFSSGISVVTYKVSNSCGSDFKTIPISVNATPIVPAITGTATVCPAATTQLNNSLSGGAWTSSDNTKATVDNNGLVTGIASGTATITYAVSNNCGTGTNTIVVTVNPAKPVVAAISGPTTVILGETISLTDPTTGGIWSSIPTTIATISSIGQVTGIAPGVANIIYSVTNTCGTASAPYQVTVLSPSVYIPNLFSPNGTGSNDVFYVRGNPAAHAEMRIFDSWGNQIFQSTGFVEDKTIGWNGTYKGKPQVAGVYIYVIKVVQPNGESTIKKGAINLIR
ncbi:Ig-like domain-containing protein [Parasediminibacterium sp. JCM 36343]|uniref:Ig-like domain-containing protein n=1 Tax=Parasediminibacterium sp. JCM 36343 TaxID=3374279 RepID=UPI003978AA5C